MKMMKNKFAKINLFSCPIYKTKIDPNSYDKEKILNDILYNKSLSNTRNDPAITLDHANIHHSYKDFNNPDFRPINYVSLLPLYDGIVNDFFNNEIFTVNLFNYKLEVINYLAMTEGQWLPSHNHLGQQGNGDDFSAIHYLQFKDDHSPTHFRNPADFAPYLKFIQQDTYNILDSTAVDNTYMFKHSWVETKEDDFVIFPAALDHEVLAQGPIKEPRITITTNIRIFKNEKSND